jgi:hypothetical protein
MLSVVEIIIIIIIIMVLQPVVGPWPLFSFWILYTVGDRLCGLVVRVPGYRSRGPGFDSRRYQIF